MSQIQLFDDGFSEESFEGKSNENGFTFWWATELMNLFEYENYTSFQKAINKAMTTCSTLNINIFDNFIQTTRIVDGKEIIDTKLSRFACYLTAMNADSKKAAVAKAQAYFASLAGAMHSYMLEAERVERIVVRDEVSEREKSLSSIAYKSGVVQYGFFQNAGYRGLYNQNINQIRKIKKVPDGRSLLDFMGKDELAANLFRITQTEIKIKEQNIRGQTALENAAESVGKQVRKTMIEISGIPPEKLTPAEDIKKVKSQLKQTGKDIKKIDTKKKPKK